MPGHTKQKYFRRAFWGLASLLLAGCEIGSSTKALTPYRAPSGSNTAISAGSNRAEVGSALTVSVALKDKNGYGISNAVPTINAVNTADGTSTGISSGGCSASNLFGVATCSLRGTRFGTYNIKVLTPVQTTMANTVNFYQVPRSLSFSVAPSSSTVSKIPFATQPQVTVLDAAGFAVPNGKTVGGTGTGVVTLSVNSANGAALLPAGSVQATADPAGGVASFAGLNVDKSSGISTYTLTASLSDSTAGTITGTSPAFSIAAGLPSKLAFTAQPGTTPANVILSPAPVVAVQDAGGNTVTTSNCVVTLQMFGGAGSDALVGTLSKTAMAGVADFSAASLRISTTTGGSSYYLHATTACAAISPADTATFTESLSGTPYQLAITQAPGSASLNQIWATQPVIQVLDSSGAIVSSDNETIVMVAKGVGSPAGGSLSGSTSILVTNGQAAFTGLSTAGAAGNYVLQFSATNTDYPVIAGISASQVIDSHGVTPAKLTYRTAPQNLTINQVAGSIVVQTLDTSGYFCSNDNGSSVRLQFTVGAGNMLQNGVAIGSLGAVTPSVTAVNGLATFTGLSFSAAGNHTLVAIAAGLTSSPAGNFAVANFSSGDHLNFYVQPVSSGSSPGTVWSTQPAVEVLDVENNRVTSDNQTLITLTCGTPSSCGLLGTVSATVINGAADFSGHSIRTNLTTAPVANVSVHAVASNSPSALIASDSASFTENPGAALPATHLNFFRQPADAGPYPVGAGQAWTQQPMVELLDINNTRVVADNTTVVTIDCVSPLTTPGCALNGSISKRVVNGLADFTLAGMYSNEPHPGGAAANLTIRATALSFTVLSNAFAGN
jgi:hypothetical protein